MPKGLNPRFVQAVSVGALSTSYTVEKLTKTSDDDRSMDFVRDGTFGNLRMWLSGIGTATQLTFFLAKDSDGDEALTPEKTLDITVGATTATDGTVTAAINSGFSIPSAAFNNGVWLCVKSGR